MIGNRKACAKTSSTPRAEARGRALDSRLRRCSMTQRQLLAAAALAAFACLASAQQKEIKIGFIYDVTGPFAGGGSEPAQLGTRAAVDMFNEKGGVEGYRINAVFADAQSKVDVAINEMTRLIDQEKVDLIMGVYSSAQCVPMVQQIDARKKFLWVNVCIATAVFKDRQLSYVFRPQAHSDQFGAASCDYIDYYAQSKFGIAPKNMRIAIIYEDGPYGAGVAAGNEAQCRKHGMNIVLKEGYSATAPDLSSLVTKLKRGIGELTREMVKRYQAVKGPGELPPHVSMGFNNTWIFLSDVLPRAIRKYGGFDAEALRKAALDTDIPPGGTLQGYGVKFYPPGAQLAGQNERAFPVVMQYVGGRAHIAWPLSIQTTDPVLPFPKGHVFAP